jgi:hypothetical protein
MSTSKYSGSESTRRVVPCPVQFARPPSGKRVVGCLWRTRRQCTAAEHAWHGAYERIADTAERSRGRDQSYGLEL